MHDRILLHMARTNLLVSLGVLTYLLLFVQVQLVRLNLWNKNSRNIQEVEKDKP